MLPNHTLPEATYIPNAGFPINIFPANAEKNSIFITSHWHEHIEMLYIIEGNAAVKCQSELYNASPGDMIIVNSNEYHSGMVTDKPLSYYCIIINPSMFQSYSTDSCKIKYVDPILSNMIVFENKIETNEFIKSQIEIAALEFQSKKTGYELAVKASIFNVLVFILRNHVKKAFSPNEYNKRMKNMETLNKVIKYIEDNYTRDMSIEFLASMANFSSCYFCSIFKELTNMTVSEYTNNIRIDKAESLLISSELNITEVALECGFNDINYFSRLFKKYKKIPPTSYRKQNKMSVYQI